MNSRAIFVCHDCLIATERVSHQFVNCVYGSENAKRAFQLFRAKHPEHDAVMHSDGHGAYSPKDYDFIRRRFRTGRFG